MSDIKERRFLVDRMLGSLCRYLRFMGYDAESANAYSEGDKKEDTVLLKRALREDRLLLTKDRELASRGDEQAVLIMDEDVIAQVGQLSRAGLIEPELRLTRCSICNTNLRRATGEEIEDTAYAPDEKDELTFFWCPNCLKLYWMGSHGKNLEKRIKKDKKNPELFRQIPSPASFHSSGPAVSARSVHHHQNRNSASPGSAHRREYLMYRHLWARREPFRDLTRR